MSYMSQQGEKGQSKKIRALAGWLHSNRKRVLTKHIVTKFVCTLGKLTFFSEKVDYSTPWVIRPSLEKLTNIQSLDK